MLTVCFLCCHISCQVVGGSISSQPSPSKTELNTTTELPSTVGSVAQQSKAANVLSDSSKDKRMAGNGAQVVVRSAVTTVVSSSSNAVVQTTVNNLKAELSRDKETAVVGKGSAPINESKVIKQSGADTKPTNLGSSVVNQSAVNSLKADLLAVKAAPAVSNLPESSASAGGTESNQVTLILLIM